MFRKLREPVNGLTHLGAAAGAIFWLVMGGLFFTAGAIIYILKKPDFFPGIFGFHEVWHIFVILGAFSHFVIMAAFVV